MAERKQLTAEALADFLLDALARPHRSNLRVTVRIHNIGGLTAHQTVNATAIHAGFDWENGQLVLETEHPLSMLSEEDVAAIRESVKKGQSWHAYKQYERQQARIKDLEAELKSLRADGARVDVAWPTVDEFAQQIRWLNGSNKMGAGTLAEKLLEWLQPRIAGVTACRCEREGLDTRLCSAGCHIPHIDGKLPAGVRVGVSPSDREPSQ